MAKDKKSFVLYADLIHTVRKMSKAKAGELFLTILQYVNDENPVVEDETIDLVFEPIKQQMKRDLRKYEDIKTKRAGYGKLGGLAKASKSKQELPNGKQNLASLPDTGNDNVNVNVFHKEQLDLKFENLKKDKYVKDSYAKYKYSDQAWTQLIADFYQNCLEKQYSENYQELVKYLSNFRKTWKYSATNSTTVNYHQPL